MLQSEIQTNKDHYEKEKSNSALKLKESDNLGQKIDDQSAQIKSLEQELSQIKDYCDI